MSTLAAIEVFERPYENLDVEDVIEVVITPSSAVEAVKLALGEYVDKGTDTIIGDMQVRGLDERNLASTLRGVGVIMGWHKAS